MNKNTSPANPLRIIEEQQLAPINSQARNQMGFKKKKKIKSAPGKKIVKQTSKKKTVKVRKQAAPDMARYKNNCSICGLRVGQKNMKRHKLEEHGFGTPSRNKSIPRW